MKSQINIHCLYSEENVPIAAGACATSTGNTTVVLLSDGFSVNKSINSLIATRKVLPSAYIVIDNNQGFSVGIKAKQCKVTKDRSFPSKYGFQQINQVYSILRK